MLTHFAIANWIVKILVLKLQTVIVAFAQYYSNHYYTFYHRHFSLVRYVAPTDYISSSSHHNQFLSCLAVTGGGTVLLVIAAAESHLYLLTY